MDQMIGEVVSTSGVFTRTMVPKLGYVFLPGKIKPKNGKMVVL